MKHSVATRRRYYELVCLEGWSLSAAALAVGASMGSSTRWWRQAFGMDVEVSLGPRGGPSIGPARGVGSGQAGRTRRILSLEDRRVIEYGLDHEHSYAHIAARLGRHRSVVKREVDRHRCVDGLYSAAAAELAATAARRRPKPFKLDNPGLVEHVSSRLKQGWSPQLIATMLRKEHRGDHDRYVNHETIYQALYVQGRGQLRTDLHRCLSTRRPRRRQHGRATKNPSSPYKEAFTISQRPAEVADRAVPGHWEGDLIVGPYARSAIGTLVERTTRFTILLHLPGRHTAAEVADAMIREMQNLPEHLRRSLTWDRGSELAEYARIQTALDMRVYFCDPHSPWQRGTDENTNRLLRHWFPKGSDLSVHTAADLRNAQDSLNARPRPTLNLDTPATRLNRLLTPTA
jgi:IS30 family transposase